MDRAQGRRRVAAQATTAGVAGKVMARFDIGDRVQFSDLGRRQLREPPNWRGKPRATSGTVAGYSQRASHLVRVKLDGLVSAAKTYHEDFWELCNEKITDAALDQADEPGQAVEVESADGEGQTPDAVSAGPEGQGVVGGGSSS